MGELTPSHGNHPFMHRAGIRTHRRTGRIAAFWLAVATCVSSLPVAFAAPPGPPPVRKPAAPPFPTKPSRYAGEKVDQFVDEMSQILAMRTRLTGPFGESQDPDAKPAGPLKPQLGQKAAEPAVPLSEIIERIEITTIMPGEKRFLIGSRSVAQGDELPITFQGKQQKIKIVQVTAAQIVFKNTATGETATRSLNQLPPGMTPGSAGSLVPGMQPASQEAPLNLDPSSP